MTRTRTGMSIGSAEAEEVRRTSPTLRRLPMGSVSVLTDTVALSGPPEKLRGSTRTQLTVGCRLPNRWPRPRPLAMRSGR